MFTVTLLTATSTLAVYGEVVVGTDVTAESRVSMNVIRHDRWQALLGRYVDGVGNVNYAAWQASADDRAELLAYLSELSHADLAATSGREARVAFWINAYNALTIEGILREYPTSSIRNHTAKLLGYNIWDDLKLKVGGQNCSLNQIEHEILRKLDEPRIHFAIVCASRSCPRLLNQAYTAATLESQLQANTTEFFTHPENFRYDPAARRFYISKILDWFAEDFGASQAERLKTLAPYLPSPAARQAAEANSVKLSYLKYDWSLNDQAPTD